MVDFRDGNGREEGDLGIGEILGGRRGIVGFVPNSSNGCQGVGENFASGVGLRQKRKRDRCGGDEVTQRRVIAETRGRDRDDGSQSIDADKFGAGVATAESAEREEGDVNVLVTVVRISCACVVDGRDGALGEDLMVEVRRCRI